METETEVALRQLDDVIQELERDDSRIGAAKSTRHEARLIAVITRLTRPNSIYRHSAASCGANEYKLMGVAKALRDDIVAGYTKSFRELVNAELFSDFLSMAEYLLTEEKLKQPAAVMAGGVLEEHIRKLCDKSSIPSTLGDGKPKKLDVMNADLAKADIYQKNIQKQITAWCGIRNSAAHAKYDEFDDTDVRHMIAGIRDFLSRFSA